MFYQSSPVYVLSHAVWYGTRISFSVVVVYPGRQDLPSNICKSIFFDFFRNAKLFLRLNKGFRSFILFSKVPPGSKSDFLWSANAIVCCNVLSCWAQLLSVFSFLLFCFVFFFSRCLRARECFCSRKRHE